MAAILGSFHATPFRSALELLLLWAILGTALYCTYTDIRWRIIPNACTYGLLLVGLVGQTWACATGRADAQTAAVTVVAAMVVGTTLFVDGVWAPGDAKLYWALAVALPPWLVRDASAASLNGPVAAIAMGSMVAYLKAPGATWTPRRWPAAGGSAEPFRPWVQAPSCARSSSPAAGPCCARSGVAPPGHYLPWSLRTRNGSP